jgi:hypothetical protein
MRKPTCARCIQEHHAKLTADLLYVDGSTFVDERRIASDDEQLAKPRQRREMSSTMPSAK